MRVFEFTPERTDGCRVTAWLHTCCDSAEMNIEKYPVMIVCPGGGYETTSDREAEPVAQEYFAAGYHTFILRYSVADHAKDFRPLFELASTIAQVRKNAKEWHVAEDKIAVCGFSAGGHLACSLGTLFNEPEFLEVFDSDANIRPDAMVLSYPVITSDEFAHEHSISRVSGSEVGSEAYKWFGLDRHVDDATPPTYLWHTAEDTCVPVENSLKFAAALSAAKVPFELHVFPKGWHGMSVCTKEVGNRDDYNRRWIPWSIEWLDKLFG